MKLKTPAKPGTAFGSSLKVAAGFPTYFPVVFLSPGDSPTSLALFKGSTDFHGMVRFSRISLNTLGLDWWGLSFGLGFGTLLVVGNWFGG